MELTANKVCPDLEAVRISPEPELSMISPANDVFPDRDAIGSVPIFARISSDARGDELNPMPILFSPAGERTIFPVVFPPIISEFFLSACRDEFAESNTNPLLFTDADSEATGAPPDMPETEKRADDVDDPPMAKSKVELEGERRLFVNCQ